MLSNSIFQDLLAWIVTYSLHSTLFLAGAWLITRYLSRDALRLKERIWKTALLGGILSATLQAGFEIKPLVGGLVWTHPAPLSVSLPTPTEILPAGVLGQGVDIEFTWERLIVGLWMLGGLLGVALFLFAWRRITDRLAGRIPVRRGPARDSLERLTARAGLRRAPRLTISKHLKSPATVGVFLPQICVPARTLTELSESQQEALLAHELAHILRRDPLWFFAVGIVERLFFFQVLNRIARRELQEIAEFLSDDWAAQNIRDELGLARCLTEVATWVLDLRPVVAVVPMAARNSRLASRITRLLDKSRKPADHRPSTPASALCLTTLALAAVCLPGANAHPQVAELPATSNPWSRGVESSSSTQPSTTVIDPLDRLLQVLDQELGRLFLELDELHASAAHQALPPERAHALADLDQRVQRLRERQQRLRSLLPALVGQAKLTQPRNPEQEETK
ncbi:MAG: beta-lactamase regulating signal transducer with metallopeptidase domain [Candidatus Paceibacteria bacterium]|jgi:beta-lactamase regulating signal transducer with metallopeptidase domain